MKYIIFLIFIGMTFYFAFANSPEFRTFVYQVLQMQEEKLKELDKNIQTKQQQDSTQTLAMKAQCSLDLKYYQGKANDYKVKLQELKKSYVPRKSEDFELVKQSFSKETFAFYGDIQANSNKLVTELEPKCKTFDEYNSVKSFLNQEKDYFFTVAQAAAKGSKFDFFNLLGKLPD